MFGRTWTHATATVVLADHYVGSSGEGSGMPSHTRMVIDVHPSAEPPFRCKLKIAHQGFSRTQRRMVPPNVGETIHVRFRPGSHKVRIVLDDAHDARAIKRRDKDRLAQIADGAVGSGVGGSGAAAGILADVATRVNGDLPAGFDLAAVLAQAGLDPAAAGSVTVVHANQGAAQPVAVSAADILASGLPGSAIVQSVELVDQPAAPGSTMVGIGLAVTLANGSSYSAANVYRVPTDKLGSVTVGARLPVRASSADHAMVAVDWAALQ
ncbi:MAG: hypothetical protein JWM98_584 [Thermoleophilia bacterium]|nr:hypothetical protein [Thermoleophilia bacterium]